MIKGAYFKEKSNKGRPTENPFEMQLGKKNHTMATTIKRCRRESPREKKPGALKKEEENRAAPFWRMEEMGEVCYKKRELASRVGETF